MAAAQQPLKGKVLAVTGAARGIGLATARYLAARGATVSMADVLKSDLEQAELQIAKETPGASVVHAVVDISKKDNVEDWIRETKKAFGAIHGFVNNAGVAGKHVNPIAELTDEDWNYVIGINLTGVFNCLRAEMGAIEEGGSIVNVSSVLGISGAPGMAPYTAAKHGVIGLTRVAAQEGAGKAIRVNAVCPGAIKTPMIDEANKMSGDAFKEDNLPQLFKRYGKPEEVAALIAYLLGDESKFTTSSIYTIDGGWVGS